MNINVVPDLCMSLKEALYEVKAKSLQLKFQYILISSNLGYNKNRLYKSLG